MGDFVKRLTPENVAGVVHKVEILFLLIKENQCDQDVLFFVPFNSIQIQQSDPMDSAVLFLVEN